LSKSAISKRYAKALVELAVEKDLLDSYAGELGQMDQLLKRESALRLLLESPTLALDKKTAIMADVAKAMQLSDGIKNFVCLLTLKDRIQYMAQIYTEYIKLADEISGVVRARVESATKLTKAQIDKIKEGLEKQTGKSVNLDTKVNSALLGGLKTEVGGKVFDGSIKTQLQRIEDTLKKG
jgi:F-type H+-transporting ATPase subunit delta